jgi:hypothetical protein
MMLASYHPRHSVYLANSSTNQRIKGNAIIIIATKQTTLTQNLSLCMVHLNFFHRRENLKGYIHTHKVTD